MAILEAINWEQLGIAGAMILLLLWQLVRSESERRFWQEKAFDGAEKYGDKLHRAVEILDNAIALLKP